MNFRDRYETDEAGNRILFTVEMQRRLSKAGLPVEVASLGQVEQTAPPSVNREEAGPPPEPRRGKEKHQERRRRATFNSNRPHDGQVYWSYQVVQCTERVWFSVAWRWRGNLLPSFGCGRRSRGFYRRSMDSL